ncbi:MAG: PhnD/SsuA/transferrin family substrate-binding protein [Rhodospirillales bacterium]|nr:PhnD/SsuA/transferrin family substrate-binding protein [Rhodospirillales bacterium]
MPLRGASLPMYNLPEMRPHNAAFWDAVRAELARDGEGDLPADLDFARPPVPPAIGADVVFTQVCGYPLQTIFRDQAIMLGAPAYAVEHCVGATHVGVFLVREDSPYRQLEDLRGCRFVFNSIHSNSGMNLPRRAIAEIAGGRPFFARVAETHSQPGNIERVAKGETDATCVDCVTFAFFRRHRPQLGHRLKVLGTTPPSPSIPFVTSTATAPGTVDRLCAALQRVAKATEWTTVRAGLMLKDILAPVPAAYAKLLDYEREAAERGYPALQ